MDIDGFKMDIDGLKKSIEEKQRLLNQLKRAAENKEGLKLSREAEYIKTDIFPIVRRRIDSAIRDLAIERDRILDGVYDVCIIEICEERVYGFFSDLFGGAYRRPKQVKKWREEHRHKYKLRDIETEYEPEYYYWGACSGGGGGSPEKVLIGLPTGETFGLYKTRSGNNETDEPTVFSGLKKDLRTIKKVAIGSENNEIYNAVRRIWKIDRLVDDLSYIRQMGKMMHTPGTYGGKDGLTEAYITVFIADPEFDIFVSDILKENGFDVVDRTSNVQIMNKEEYRKLSSYKDQIETDIKRESSLVS